MMRAILIDPEKQSLTEIQIEGNDYRETNKIIGSSRYALGAYLNGSFEDGFDAVAVSDDDMEERDDPRLWFQVDADRNPPSSHPLAGRGLVVGTDPEGSSCDARISVEELRSRLTFTQRKFRGFETYTGADARARGGLVVVELKAPIIDGTNG